MDGDTRRAAPAGAVRREGRHRAEEDRARAGGAGRRAQAQHHAAVAAWRPTGRGRQVRGGELRVRFERSGDRRPAGGWTSEQRRPPRGAGRPLAARRRRRCSASRRVAAGPAGASTSASSSARSAAPPTWSAPRCPASSRSTGTRSSARGCWRRARCSTTTSATSTTSRPAERPWRTSRLSEARGRCGAAIAGRGARLHPDQRLAGLGALGSSWAACSCRGGATRSPGLSYWAVNRFTFIELALVLVAGSVLLALYGAPRAAGSTCRSPTARWRRAPASGAASWCWRGSPTRPAAADVDYGLRWGFLVALLRRAAGVRGYPGRRRHHRGQDEALAADQDATRRPWGGSADDEGARHRCDRQGRARGRVALVTAATRCGAGRDPRARGGVLPAEVEAVRGDVTDPASVERAVEGCEWSSTRWACPSSGCGRVDLRPGERGGHARVAPRRGEAGGAAARAHEHRGRLPRRARAASTSRGSRTTRRARPTSARSSALRSSRWRRGTGSRS